MIQELVKGSRSVNKFGQRLSFSTAMAFLESSFGDLSWICEADSHLSFHCIQRAIINGVDLIFLCFFYLFLLITFQNRNNPTRESRRRNYVSIFVSLCCAVISSAYFIASLLNLASENDRKSGFVCLISGLVWTSFAASLLVKWSYSIIILSSIWWVCSFLVVSALNTLLLVRHVRIELLDLISWPVSFLLSVCAFINVYHFLTRDTRNGELSRSLLDKEDRIKKRPVNFLSKLVFSWMNPLLSLGYKKPLALNDIPTLDPEDEAELAYQNFSNVWLSFLGEKNSSNKRNLIFHAISKVYLKENMFIAILALSKTISVVASPLILYFFINYSNGDRTNVREGLTIVGCLIISKVVESLCQRHWFFLSRRSGMRMRSALMVAIYQKQLKLSSLGRKRHSTGEIVNYIAVDAYRIGEFPWWFHLAWSSSLQLFLAIGVLFGVVGLGALLGLIPLIICGLLNLPFAKILQKCQSEFMTGQDERLRSTSEILNSMKIIKLQSWGDKFKSLIESRRDAEFKWLAEAQFKKVYSTLLYWTSPTIVSSVVFCGYILFGDSTLNASTIFTVLATLRTMSEPVRMIPEALSIMIQVKVSLQRINAFLLDDELKAGGMCKNRSENYDKRIVIETANFSWDLDAMIPTLRDVNFDMKFGEKIAVCGQVGAGKSSFLHAVLGEIPKLSGKVQVFGSIAYVSQTAWIQSGTIRENILFGKPMESDRYEMVIKVCALDKDISNFDHGDLTEIGQRGINMSGGQKQRIQLARAVYNDVDIYLLDDPFSAVDAHTAATLFNDCVMTALHKKTVILVTHQVEFLAEVDKILVLEGGRIAKSGSYEELLTAGTALEKLVNAHESAITALNPSNRVNSLTVNTAEDLQGSYVIKEQHKGDKGQPSGQLTEEEEKEIGDVGWKPFWDYIGIANGSFVLCLGIISQACFTILQAASTYWLALAIQFPQITNGMLIGIYTAISLLSTLFVFLRSFFGAHLGLKASKAFFSGFTDSIFAAPMSFFDSTPVGRILTRASSDLSILDFDIPFSIVFIVAGGIELLAVILIMAAVTWQVLIVATVALVGSHYLQGYYLASARELMRINGTTKAPLMNYAAETSLGLVTIRAFGMADWFFCNFLKLVDTDASLFFHSNAATEWLLLRVEALQNLTLFTAAFLLVLLPNSNLNPGLVGLSLSYALSLTLTQIFVTKWYCSLSNYIVSVERIKQFMHLPSEPPAVVEDNRPPCSWPSKGRIELESLKIRYRPNSSLVLNGISCIFEERSRVGIVGRTGSGKTTLISALFRLVDPASGRILIDGIDICSIGLKDLRMKLSIIPQEATLFRGSVRTNLDPLGLYSDEELWKALEKCQLKETISSLPNQLDSHVSDEGENWSAGQRQLFCLGRVLLRRNRILVLDEATASIDSATDATLQRVIREEFSDCTVLTVAHRVPTVIDSDKVLVLSFGRVVEYEEPWKLMESNQSSFSKLVAEYWSSCRRNSYQNLNRH